MRIVIAIAFAFALAAACGGKAAPPPTDPATTQTQTVSIVHGQADPVGSSVHTGSPSKRVEQGMVQTGCSNGIYDCADDEICVITHTGATLASCVVDECPGAVSCDCSADACGGMSCDDADATHRTLTCSSGSLAP